MSLTCVCPYHRHPHHPHMPQLSSAVCVVIQLQVSALIRRCSCICYSCCCSSCCCCCCCYCNCRLAFEMFRRLSLALLCGWFLVFWEQQKQTQIKNTRVNWTVMGFAIPCSIIYITFKIIYILIIYMKPCSILFFKQMSFIKQTHV